MSVTSTTLEVVESGNGVKSEFDFTFKIQAAAELVVRRKTAGGVISDPLILDTDYTVAFDTDAETGTVSYIQDDPENPGTPIAYPIESGGESIIARRSVPLTQATVWPREGTTPAKTLENAHDKAVLLIQQLQDQLDRALVQPASPASPDPISVDPPTDRRGLVYEDNGDGTWTIVPTDDDPDEVLPLAEAQAAIATAQAAIATAQAAAAAASAVAAAASASLVSAAVGSGLWSARPAAPSSFALYYSTDRDSLELWVPAAARWFLIG